MNKLTIDEIKKTKNVRKLTALTAYDYPMARLLDEAEMDIVLVGDSMGMVVFGEKSTKFVTMLDMIRATKSVQKGVSRALLVADLPVGSFDNPQAAVQNAQFLTDAGADAVKIEGYGAALEVTKELIANDIPVMGHLGLTPQTADEFKIQGKTEEDAARILKQASQFDACGIFSLVLECIPSRLAAQITSQVSVPTIGIGAGPETDGQILVTADLLGLYPNMHPKFVRKYADLSQTIKKAVTSYRDDVIHGKFPSKKESY